MKKFLIAFSVLIVAVLSIGGFLSEYGSYFADPILKELPIYKSKEIYSSGFWMDFTTYGKFTYKNVSEEELQSAESFEKITEEDIEKITDCIDTFEVYAEQADVELKENYDFDKTVISTEDYYCMEGHYNSATFNVFYFDSDKQTLYYFHNDI